MLFSEKLIAEKQIQTEAFIVLLYPCDIHIAEGQIRKRVLCYFLTVKTAYWRSGKTVFLLTLQRNIMSHQNFRVKQCKAVLNHNVICYGYTFEIDRAGKFDVERANASGVPQKIWGLLQKGETVEVEGITYTPDMVMGPARKGIKLTYCTDTRPTDSIVENAKKSDLFICRLDMFLE